MSPNPIANDAFVVRFVRVTKHFLNGLFVGCAQHGHTHGHSCSLTTDSIISVQYATLENKKTIVSNETQHTNKQTQQHNTTYMLYL
jgi:hypothetical protein